MRDAFAEFDRAVASLLTIDGIDDQTRGLLTLLMRLVRDLVKSNAR